MQCFTCYGELEPASCQLSRSANHQPRLVLGGWWSAVGAWWLVVVGGSATQKYGNDLPRQVVFVLFQHPRCCMVVGGWWLAVGGWRLVVGEWWPVVGCGTSHSHCFNFLANQTLRWMGAEGEEYKRTNLLPLKRKRGSLRKEAGRRKRAGIWHLARVSIPRVAATLQVPTMCRYTTTFTRLRASKSGGQASSTLNE